MSSPNRKRETKKTDAAYVSFNDNDKSQIMKAHASTIDSYSGIQRATATQLTSDHYIRSPFSRTDYDRMRPNERIPSRFRDVVVACRAMYLRLGIVRNVIDMMTDFTTEDMRLIHPDKTQEAFFRVWMKKVKLKESVDEFVRHFLIDGNVVIKRNTAKLSKPVQTQWTKVQADDSSPEKLYVEDTASKGEIPWRYTFLNVAALEWLGGDLAKSMGQKQLVFRLSNDLIKSALTPNDPFSQNLSSKVPEDVRDAIRKNGEGFYQLDMDKLYIAFNKKDSWEDWAPPFLYAILNDVNYRDKLRQAEISALDGVINVIRIWKLGDHENGILPNQAVVNKLSDILQTNTGGGAFDLVWDSMLDMQEYYPPIDKILGSEKYEQVNRDILIGLGVPEVLIGGKGGNFSNSFIQLKTLVEKLQYVRDRVCEWLNTELKMVCEAMGIDTPPKVRFNQMSLEDEASTRQLIIGLLDRGIISVEAVLDVYGEDFLFEMGRIKAEKPVLKNAGVDVKSPLDPKPVAGPGGSKPPAGKTGRVGKGRPPGRNSTTQKERKPKPRRTAADLAVFALDAIDAIDEHVIPVYMESMNVSNARKLTNDQKDLLTHARILVMSTLKPSDDISKDSILSIAENSTNYNKDILVSITKAVNAFISKNGVEPTLSQRKRIEAMAWAEQYSM
jgi:hypothetical protein